MDDNNLDDVDILLKGGADPNMKDERGNSLLQLATLNDDTEMVKLLLHYGAKPNLDSFDRSSLDTAISKRNFEIVKLLLGHDADPNRKNALSWTPLQSTAMDDKLDIADILLRYRADPFIQNNRGENAYDIARQYGNRRLIALMDFYETQIKEPEYQNP